MIKKLFAFTLAAAASSAAHAGTFIDGSFEANSCATPPYSFVTLGTGSNCISGWSVTGGSVDLVDTYWQAKDGSYSIDLAGNEPGTISQTFDTVAGTTYQVFYWLSGNPDGGNEVKSGSVSAMIDGDVVTQAFLSNSGLSHENMAYSLYSFFFTADSEMTTLSFMSGPDEGPYGPVLDLVSVAAVPEPATWAMMLIGFGGIGFAMRRRRRRGLAAQLA